MPIDADGYMAGIIPTLSRGGSWLPRSAVTDGGEDQQRGETSSASHPFGQSSGNQPPQVSLQIPRSAKYPARFPSGTLSGIHSVGLSGPPLLPTQPPMLAPFPLYGMFPDFSILSLGLGGISPVHSQFEGGSPSVTPSESLGRPIKFPSSVLNRGHERSSRRSSTAPSSISGLWTGNLPVESSGHLTKMEWEKQAGAPKPLFPELTYKRPSSETIDLRPHRPKAESLPEPDIEPIHRERRRSTREAKHHALHPEVQDGPKSKIGSSSKHDLRGGGPAIRSAGSPSSPYRPIDHGHTVPSPGIPSSHPQLFQDNPDACPKAELKVGSNPKRPFPARHSSYQITRSGHSHHHQSSGQKPQSSRPRHVSSPSLYGLSKSRSNLRHGPTIDFLSPTPDRGRRDQSDLGNIVQLRDHLPPLHEDESIRSGPIISPSIEEAHKSANVTSASRYSGMEASHHGVKKVSTLSIRLHSPTNPSNQSAGSLIYAKPDHTLGYIAPASSEPYDRYATHPAAPVPSKPERQTTSSSSSTREASTIDSPTTFAATATTQTPLRSDTVAKEDWYLPMGYARPPAPAPLVEAIRERPSVLSPGVPWYVGEEKSPLLDKPEGPRWVQARPPRSQVIHGGGWWESGGEGMRQ